MPIVQAGEILLKAVYVSVDPYLRVRMNDVKSGVAPSGLQKPIHSGMIAEVIESEHVGFSRGEYVYGMLDWKLFQLSDGEGLLKADAEKALLSSYLGLTEIGKPMEAETVVASGAAGAVGSVAGQNPVNDSGCLSFSAYEIVNRILSAAGYQKGQVE